MREDRGHEIGTVALKIRVPRAGETPEAPAKPEAGRGGWGAVAMLGAGAFAIGTDMFVVAGTGIARDLEVTVGVAGSAVTVSALAYATGAVLLDALPATAAMLVVVIGWGAAWGFVPA